MLPSSGLEIFFVLLVLTMLCVAAMIFYTGLQNTRDRGDIIVTSGLSLCALIVVLVIELFVASNGWLEQFDRPPPSIALLLVPVLITTVVFSSVASIGERLATGLSVRTLIAFQSFRFGPELFLHLGYVEGSLPSQMTFPPEGRNVDVLTAAAATALALYAHSGPGRPLPRALVWAFALGGLASLANISYTSLRSLAHWLRPTDWQPGLEAMALPPYILLPGYLFQLALCGQLLLVRKLLLTGGGPAAASAEMW